MLYVTCHHSFFFFSGCGTRNIFWIAALTVTYIAALGLSECSRVKFNTIAHIKNPFFFFDSNAGPGIESS